MSSPVNLAMCIDANHALPACVALTSALQNDPDGRILPHFLIGRSEPLERLLREICGGFGREPVIASTEFMPGLNRDEDLHLSPAAYARLFLAEAFPKAGRILYLDADTLVRRGLEALWETDLQGAPLAAVQDGWVLADPDLHRHFGGHYLNSGMILLDAAQWRAGSLGKRVTDFLIDWRRGKAAGGYPELAAIPELSEQSALNLTLGDRWVSLDPTWNFTRFLSDGDDRRLGYSTGTIATAARDPAIVHYAGHAKPWLPPFRSAGRYHVEYCELASLLESRVDTSDFAGPRAPDFGHGAATKLAIEAAQLVEQARRAGCHRLVIFGTSALARKIRETVSDNGMELLCFASTAALHAGGAISDIRVESLDQSLSHDMDGIIIGEWRLVDQAISTVQTALAARDKTVPVIAPARSAI